MRRSQPTPLIALGLAGLVVGFLLELAAAASGVPIVVPPLSLPFTLVAVAVIVLLLAWPIRQSTREAGKAPVNPFFAMRVAVLAKSSSFTGSLVLGLAVGIVLYLLTRSVVPALGSVWLAVAMVVGAAILLVAGLVAEHFCTLPPTKNPDNPGEARV